MLTRRVLPCLDVDRGRVVKGTSFRELVDAGDPVELARAYDRQGADELVFLDITASHEERRTVYEVVERTAAEVFVPLTVGGGIRALGDMESALAAGADKVAVNTAAVERPELVRDGARRFGTQCIVVAVDVRRVPGSDPLRFEVVTHGGRRGTGRDGIEWLRRVEELGAGEILLTSMDRDGRKDGYDLELYRLAAAAIAIPVIASGGAGGPEHLAEVLAPGGADAVLAASIFHFGAWTVDGVKAHLQERGIPVRRDEEVRSR